jgi:metallo-beta-lactamase family protein
VKLHFLGANRQVTGSRYCLEAAGRKLMIDCGMFQERQYQSRNWEPSPIPPGEIDDLLLTHVHIDHCGLLPRLVREGYRGPIHATRPSVELAEIMLRDAARIQVEDAEYKLRRHRKEGRRGKFPEVALFDESDVQRTLPLLSGVPYGKPLKLNDALSVTFHEAGHILGSAMIEILVREPGQDPTRLIFSGDIGQWDKPLVRNPTLFEQADYVIMESTYGDRQHEDGGDIEDQLQKVIQQTVERGGKVVIPTFAVERSQELMYYISRLVHDDRIPNVKIFLDSPMAVDVTEIFQQFQDCFDAETWQLITSGEPPLRFPGLRMVRSAEESKQLNRVREPCVIMATSGMCTAGRIKHHLRQNIERSESTILFVGYQAEGTLGRQILQRRPEVRIHGRTLQVRAQVAQIFGFSGHADRPALMRWLSHLRQPPRQVFLTHGDEQASLSLAANIRDTLGWPVSIPNFQEVIELA